MAKNLKLFFDRDGSPRARGPSSEKILMAFLETDIQGSEHICFDLINDLDAIEDESAESREFAGNAHAVTINSDGVTIEAVAAGDANDDESDASAATHVDAAAPDTAETAGTPTADHPSETIAESGKSVETRNQQNDSTLASDDTKPASTQNTGSLNKKAAYEKAHKPDPYVYHTGLKHFREVLEDWEAFILDDQSPA